MGAVVVVVEFVVILDIKVASIASVMIGGLVGLVIGVTENVSLSVLSMVDTTIGEGMTSPTTATLGKELSAS
jgi:hypothetical protein